MRKFLGFFGLTTATQLCLLVNQLVLLPLQLSAWGQETTSEWFVILAIANLASFADLGLRSAGHADLVASVHYGDPAAAERFRPVWALTRAVIVIVVAIMLVIQTLLAWRLNKPFEPWGWAITVSLALDTVVIVRGMWLDTLGRFAGVESLFLTMVASRVLLSIVALAQFRAPPEALAWIMALTACGTAIAQAWLLPKPASLAFLSSGFRSLQWRSLAVVRLVIAEPVSNWVRFSLPVLVLAAISGPTYVTTYVALRAIFGLGRQMINQVARYASIRYVQRASEGDLFAKRIVTRAVLLSAFVGMAVSCGVIADHGRVLHIWLHSSDPRTIAMIATSFAVGATVYGYQVSAGVLMRQGDVAGIAWRQYTYLFASFTAALVAWLSGSSVLYLVLLALQEVFIAGLFVQALGIAVARISVMAFAISASLIGVVWTAVALDPANLFSTGTVDATAASLLIAGVVAVVAGGLFAALDLMSSSAVSTSQAPV